jgi:hypothetical protein
MKENLKNPHIEDIVVLYEPAKGLPADFDRFMQESPNITVITIDQRPLFKDLFEYCNKYKDQKWIVSNADIYFPVANQDKLKELLDQDYSKQCFTLSRYNIMADLPQDTIETQGGFKKTFDGMELRTQHSQGWSADCWIFKAPIELTKINAEIPIGIVECDGMINNELSKIYEISNPCLSVIAIHKHKGWDESAYAKFNYEGREYTRKQYQDLMWHRGMRIKYVRMCKLPSDRNTLPVIVFPFWCQDEVDQYCWMMERWDKLTKTSHDYMFLLVSRFDFTGSVRRLTHLCNQYGKTAYKRLDGTRVGHPLGCNEMWAKGIQEVNKIPNARFAFWMEYDVFPKHPGWFDELVSKWDDELMVAGHLVSETWLNANGFPSQFRDRNTNGPWGAHINGAAMYNPLLADLLDMEDVARRSIGWDVQLSKRVHQSLTYGYGMYDFRLNRKNPGPTGTDGKLIHGLKTIQDKRGAYREFPK